MTLAPNMHFSLSQFGLLSHLDHKWNLININIRFHEFEVREEMQHELERLRYLRIYVKVRGAMVECCECACLGESIVFTYASKGEEYGMGRSNSFFRTYITKYFFSPQRWWQLNFSLHLFTSLSVICISSMNEVCTCVISTDNRISKFVILSVHWSIYIVWVFHRIGT